jgi:hypothetical protein
MTCPGCPPHPPHAGRCYVKTLPTPGRLVECRCKEKAHVDRPSIPSQRSPGAAERPASVPSGLSTYDEAQRHLTAASQTLVAVGTDLLGQINAIGQTATDGAARLRREGT